MPIDSPPMAQEKVSIGFLINPISGGGIGHEVHRFLPEILDSFGIPRESWISEMTEAKGLVEQTDRFLNRCKRVIAVGGDGTIGLVLDRWIALQEQNADAKSLLTLPAQNTEIGLIPLGTGNDLARTLGVYRIYDQKGLLACAQRLIKAPAIPFDLWRVNGKLTMASYISVGMDAAILHDFDTARKAEKIPRGAIWNKLFYLKSACQRVGHHLASESRIVWNQTGLRRELDISGKKCVLITNINSYAAGAHPFPEGNFDDRRLEFCVFRDHLQFSAIAAGSRIFPRLAKWMRRDLPLHHAESLTLYLDPREYVQLDGEDIRSQLAENGKLEITFAGQAKLLDLRTARFSLF